MTLALVRVDDRLVHGQVVVAWSRHVDAARYLVVDDALAASDFERLLVSQSAAPLAVEIAGVERGVELARAEESRAGHAILLVRGPAQAPTSPCRHGRRLRAALWCARS